MSKKSAHKDVQRRTWDKAKYEEAALEKRQEDFSKRPKVEPKKRAERIELVDGEARPDHQYDFESFVGKRRMVNDETALSGQGGFFCEACDFLAKDDKTYLDHCNKPRHLINMGLPLTFQNADVGDVAARLEMHRERDLKAAKLTPAELLEQHKQDVLSKIRKQSDAVAKEKAEKKRKRAEEQNAVKKEAKRELTAEELMMQQMGLPVGFDTTK